MAKGSKQFDRRTEIMDAAMALIERHDLATLRLVDVADELGLTANAVRYYFRDLGHLLAELTERSNRRLFADRREALAVTPDPRCQLALTIDTGLPRGADDAEWRAISRGILAAGFELDQRPDVQSIFHRQVALYSEILCAGAQAEVFDLRGRPEDIAMTLMTMEDYLGYRIVARDPTVDRPTALRLMRGYAELAIGAGLPEPSAAGGR